MKGQILSEMAGRFDVLHGDGLPLKRDTFIFESVFHNVPADMQR